MDILLLLSALCLMGFVSCSRYNSYNCWCANGRYGYANNNNLNNSNLVVPLVNYGRMIWKLIPS